MYAFAPGGGLVYNHDDNWQWFGGVYKGFNLPGPSSARDDGSPVEKETSIAKEIGVRYSSPTFFMSWTVGFHTDFKDLIVIDNSNTDSAPDNAGNVVSKGFELSSTSSSRRISNLFPEEISHSLLIIHLQMLT